MQYLSSHFFKLLQHTHFSDSVHQFWDLRFTLLLKTYPQNSVLWFEASTPQCQVKCVCLGQELGLRSWTEIIYFLLIGFFFLKHALCNKFYFQVTYLGTAHLHMGTVSFRLCLSWIPFPYTGIQMFYQPLLVLRAQTCPNCREMWLWPIWNSVCVLRTLIKLTVRCWRSGSVCQVQCAYFDKTI